MFCTPMEIQARSAKVEARPFEIEIGTATPCINIQIMSGDKSKTKVNTVKVCPDSGAQCLIRESMAVSL